PRSTLFPYTTLFRSVLGAFGGRLDHSLAALLFAARLAGAGKHLDLHGGPHSAWPLTAGTHLALELPVGTTVSIVSLMGGSRLTRSEEHTSELQSREN